MIIVKIVGGLASQLHKYSIGRALSIKYNTELKFDLSWYKNIPKNDTNRVYLLEKFNIIGKEASSSEIKKYKPNKYLIKIVNKLNILGFNIKFKHYSNQSYMHEVEFNLLSNNIYIEGEWAGYKYFSKIRNILLNELTLKDNTILKKNKYIDLIANNITVSIHFRRGDYISNIHAKKLHTQCSKEYYLEALNIIKKKEKYIHLLVFSDDIVWIKENINFDIKNVIYIENLEDYEELSLMSKCTHNIIANSFFSWMPSWINKNKDKLVISPNNWVIDSNLNKYILDNISDKNLILLDNK